MSSAYMCGCVIHRPGSDPANHYCSRHVPPEEIVVMQKKIVNLEAERGDLKNKLQGATIVLGNHVQKLDETLKERDDWREYGKHAGLQKLAMHDVLLAVEKASKSTAGYIGQDGQLLKRVRAALAFSTTQAEKRAAALEAFLAAFDGRKWAMTERRGVTVPKEWWLELLAMSLAMHEAKKVNV